MEALTKSPSRSQRTYRSRRWQKRAPVDHILHLFDTDESRAYSVAAFLDAGAIGGQSVLIVATRAHWSAIASELRRLRGDLGNADDQRMTVVDADELLSGVMRQGRPDRTQFDLRLGTIVRHLLDVAPGGLRIYGEMVELLAQDGNYAGAADLERLWNDLQSDCRFGLLCGYSAAHFAAPDAGSALSVICREHSRSLSDCADPLGQFLLESEQTRHSLLTPEDPR